MTKNLIILFTITLGFIASKSVAQVNNYQLTGSYKSKEFISKQYFNKGSIKISAFGSCPRYSVSMVNHSGVSLWEKKLPLYYGNIAAVAINPIDSSIIIAGSDWLSHDAQEKPVINIFFLNSTGSIYKILKYDTDTISTVPIMALTNTLKDIALINNSILCLILDNSLMKIDTNGNILAKVNIPRNPNKLYVDKKKIAVLTDDGIYFYTHSLAFTSQTNKGHSFLNIVSNKKNHFLLSSDNKVLETDISWNIIDSFRVNDGRLVSMQCNDTSLFVLMNKAENNFIREFDTKFKLKSVSLFSDDKFTPLDFSIVGSNLLLSGYFTFHKQEFRYRQLALIGDTAFSSTSFDIGITNVDIQNYSQTVYSSFGPVTYMVSFDVYATIQNYSVKDVQQFSLSSDTYEGENCTPRFFNKTFDTIVPAGSEIKLYLGYYNKLHQVGDDIDICLFTLAPNMEMDADTANDVYCLQQRVLSSKQTPDVSNISIYPNPANNYIVVQLCELMNTQNAFFHFSDVTERSKYIFPAKDTETLIDVTSWQRGVYFFQIQYEATKLKSGRLVLE